MLVIHNKRKASLSLELKADSGSLEVCMKKRLDNEFSAWINEFYHWSYCSQNKCWYEDGVEDLPQPKTKTDTSRFDFAIYIGQLDDDDDVISDDQEEIEEYVNSLFNDDPDDDAGLYSQISFISDKRYAAGCFSKEDICEIDRMISEIRKKDNCAYFIESGYFKFFTWKITDKQIRFAIFNYSIESERYLQCVFDVTAKKDLIISKLEYLVETWKEAVYEAIKHKEELLNKKFVNHKKDRCIDHFFPEYKEI